MTNLVLSYGGLYAKYTVADQNMVTAAIMQVYKNSFAEKYVIKSWYEQGKLNNDNFYYDSQGRATSLNYESLNNEKNTFIQEVDDVIQNIKITFQEEK